MAGILRKLGPRNKSGEGGVGRVKLRKSGSQVKRARLDWRLLLSGGDLAQGGPLEKPSRIFFKKRSRGVFTFSVSFFFF